MNILFVASFKIQNSGGVGTVTEALTKSFDARGYNVYYLAISNGNNYSMGNIKQFFLPHKRINSKVNINYVKDLIKKLDIDIIVNQSATIPSVYNFLNKIRNNKVKIISAHHGCVLGLQENYELIILNSFHGTFYYKFIKIKLIQLLLKKYSRVKLSRNFKKTITYSDKLVLLSKNYKDELKFFIKNFDANKVVSIHNPLPFDIIPNIEYKKENRLLYIGRINYKEKQVNLLLDIWSELYKEFPEWEFDIVGDGPQLEELKLKSKEKNLKRINFYGYTNPEPYLIRAKLLCLTSIIEGFGLVLIEAQAYGVVPISFDISSNIGEIIKDDLNGKIIPKFNLHKYIYELKSLMNDETKIQNMAREARRTVYKFNINKITNEWDALFNSLISEKKSDN